MTHTHSVEGAALLKSEILTVIRAAVNSCVCRSHDYMRTVWMHDNTCYSIVLRSRPRQRGSIPCDTTVSRFQETEAVGVSTITITRCEVHRIRV